MKKNIKTIIGLLIAFIIGISTTVGAATVFNSKDITYSSDKTTKKNVKDSLDELYIKAASAGQCPNGYYCYTAPKTVKMLSVGDYISMTPTSTSYTISKDLTGYTTDQTINPSELNLWRVISKNSDGTVDVVSHYMSSNEVYFKGTTGYMNFVGALNTIAAQYANTKYVSKTRNYGYSNQIEYCSTYNPASSCPGDDGYETDNSLVGKVYNTWKSWKIDNSTGSYWVSSRAQGDGLQIRAIDSNGNWLAESTYWGSYGNRPMEYKHSIRPILTLNPSVIIKDGNGSQSSPYTLN